MQKPCRVQDTFITFFDILENRKKNEIRPADVLSTGRFVLQMFVESFDDAFHSSRGLSRGSVKYYSHFLNRFAVYQMPLGDIPMFGRMYPLVYQFGTF